MAAVQELASPKANGFWANGNCDSPLLGVNTPRSDEDRLKLMELMVFMMKKGVCDEFELNAARLSNYIHYALTVSPHIYISCIKQFWNSVLVKRSGDVTRLQALVDKKKIVIFEDVIREILRLNDAEGVKFLIHTILQSLSAKRTSWNEFSTAMASAVICLSKGQRFNFSWYIFDSLVRNVDSSSKFYMYPRFIQLIIQAQVVDLSSHTTCFISPALTQKVPAQSDDVHEHVAEEVATHVIPSLPPHQSPCSPQPQDAEGSSHLFQQDEGIELVVDQEKDVEVEGRHADKQAKMYNIDLDHSSKVLSMQEDDTEVQEAVEIVTTAKLMIEVVTATQKKDQVEMDAEYAKKLQEELDKEHEESFKNIDWNAALDHIQSKEPQYIRRYHGIKKKPQTESEVRKNMISYLRNTEGYKMEFFKGLKYDDILSIFQARFDANLKFLFKSREEMDVENKMHKAFPLPGESSHWQYKFPLPVKVVPTTRRLEMPLPRVCTSIEEMMKKLPVKDRWQLH
nr:synaptobrevin, longin-like domain protein [Tanacetum cinerariifolium]